MPRQRKSAGRAVQAVQEIEQREGQLELLRPALETAEEEAKAGFRTLLGHMEAVEREGLALGRVLRRLHGGEDHPDGSKTPRLYQLRNIAGGWEGYLAWLMQEVQREHPSVRKLSVSWSYDLIRASQTAEKLSARAESVSPQIVEQLTPKQLAAVGRFKDPGHVLSQLTAGGTPPSASQIRAYGAEHRDELAATGRKGGATAAAEETTRELKLPPSVVRWAHEQGIDGIGELIWDEFPEEIGDLVVWLVGKLTPEERQRLMERLQA